MKRNTHVSLAGTALAAAAFANAPAAAPTAGKPATAPAPVAPLAPPAVPPAAAPTAPAPVVLAIRNDIKMPTNIRTGRGSKSKYPFDDLAAPAIDDAGEPIYASFGVKNMDKTGFSSTLFTANKKHKSQQPKRDAAGAVIMKTGPEIKDAAGAVVGHGPGTEPETVEVKAKEFVAVEIDPKNDPEGASLRVFRIK